MLEVSESVSESSLPADGMFFDTIWPAAGLVAVMLDADDGTALTSIRKQTRQND
jgi:hypothetical protein